MKVGIIGAGYTGARLAHRLLADGHLVRAGRRSDEALAAVARLGAETHSVDLATGRGLDDFADCDAIVHLAPPPEPSSIDAEVARLHEKLGHVPIVYGSTTGVFGQQPNDAWVDESTSPGPLQPRGARRVAYGTALSAAGFSLRQVFIAGIYGPGRSMFESLERGISLFDGGPSTSRIHVDDLVSILLAQLDPGGIDAVIACDELPAPTLEVAKFAATLAGWELPPVLDLEEAKSQMSDLAKELRLNGRRCRSLHRGTLVPALLHPSYREGLRSCWLSREAGR